MSAVKKSVAKHRKPALLDRLIEGTASLLVYGPTLPIGPIVAQIKRKLGALDPLDAREPIQAESALRAEVSSRLDRNPVLVVLLGSQVSAAARAVLSEVLEGQLNTREGTRALDPNVRVIALVSATVPDEDLAAMFPMRLAAAAALRPAVSEA